MRTLKNSVASTFDVLGMSAGMLWLHRAVRMPYIRVLNYHDVPAHLSGAFEEQLRYYSERFSPVTYDDLLALQAGKWRPRHPGLILSFDDGLASHASVVAPLLERYGFVGWFMVPVGFVDAAPSQQASYAADNRIQVPHSASGSDRTALSWDEVRFLDRAHVVGCHTWSHRRLGADVTRAEAAHPATCERPGSPSARPYVPGPGFVLMTKEPERLAATHDDRR